MFLSFNTHSFFYLSYSNVIKFSAIKALCHVFSYYTMMPYFLFFIYITTSIINNMDADVPVFLVSCNYFLYNVDLLQQHFCVSLSNSKCFFVQLYFYVSFP